MLNFCFNTPKKSYRRRGVGGSGMRVFPSTLMKTFSLSSGAYDEEATIPQMSLYNVGMGDRKVYSFIPSTEKERKEKEHTPFQ